MQFPATESGVKHFSNTQARHSTHNTTRLLCPDARKPKHNQTQTHTVAHYQLAKTLAHRCSYVQCKCVPSVSHSVRRSLQLALSRSHRISGGDSTTDTLIYALVAVMRSLLSTNTNTHIHSIFLSTSLSHTHTHTHTHTHSYRERVCERERERERERETHTYGHRSNILVPFSPWRVWAAESPRGTVAAMAAAAAMHLHKEEAHPSHTTVAEQEKAITYCGSGHSHTDTGLMSVKHTVP